ncbi:MAG: hypothetical protein AAF488_16095 [Planctomycetota bacterium]
MKWRDFATHYVERCVSKMSPNTQDRYVRSVAHINKRFGDHWLDAIDPLEMEDWRDEWRRTTPRERSTGGYE